MLSKECSVTPIMNTVNKKILQGVWRKVSCEHVSGRGWVWRKRYEHGRRKRTAKCGGRGALRT
jgi:hypothetical protein